MSVRHVLYALIEATHLISMQMPIVTRPRGASRPVEAMSTLKSPRLVGVVEVGFPVVADCLTIRVDDNGRVVILGIAWPVICNVYLFGVANDDITFILEGSSPCPERTNSGTRRFEIR